MINCYFGELSKQGLLLYPGGYSWEEPLWVAPLSALQQVLGERVRTITIDSD